MTLIASFNFDGFPVLLGDSMVSTTIPAGSVSPYEIKLPTGAATPEKLGDDGNKRVVSKLMQKLIIINDYIVIGWTGTAFIAKRIIDELKTYFNSQQVSTDNLNAFWAKIPEEYKENVSLVGALYEKHTNIVATFGLGAPPLSTESKFSNFFVGGSGSLDIYDLMETFESIEFKQTGGENAEQAVGIASAVINALLDAEIKTGRPQENFYGGAYEIAYFTGKKFAKIGRIAYYSSTATIDADGNIKMELLKRVMCTNYDGKDLYVRCTNISGSQVKSEDIHLITEPYSNKQVVRTDCFREPIFFSHILTVIKDSTPVAVSIKLEKFSNITDRPFTVETGRNREFRISKSWLERTAAELTAKFKADKMGPSISS